VWWRLMVVFGILAVAAVLSYTPWLARPHLVTPSEVALTDLYRKSFAAVVTVEVELKPEVLVPGMSPLELGSGFFVTANDVVTNYHVVADGQRVTVVLSNDQRVKAKVAAVDPGFDLAVVRLEEYQSPIALTFGRSAGLQPGQALAVIGSPGGASGSVTSGPFVSHAAVGPESQHAGAEVPRWLATQAAILPGNSGGPVIDTGGSVVGVAAASIQTSFASRRGVGLAVPADLAASAVADLLRYGHPTRGFFGARVADAAEGTLRGARSGGAVIEQVDPGSPASQAGLQALELDSMGRVVAPGDVVINANDRVIRGAADLLDELADRRPGEALRLTVAREGRERVVLIVLSTPP
jgi:serine protease Do